MSNLDDVKRRIRGLIAKTTERGASEAEAFAAMEKVGDLLAQFNLSMDEVLVREQTVIHKTRQTNSKHRDALFSCIVGVGELCEVKVWITRSHEGIVHHLFGLESDVLAADYLCDVITNASIASYAEFKVGPVYRNFSGHRRRLEAGFRMGFGSRMSRRLNDMRIEKTRIQAEANKFAVENTVAIATTDAAKAEAAKQTTGTALVVVAKKDHIESEFEKAFDYKLTNSVSTRRAYSSAGYNAGAAAADNVRLNKALAGNSNKPTGYLK